MAAPTGRWQPRRRSVDRTGAEKGTPKSVASFWSTQSAAAASLATFGFRDLTDALLEGPLAGSSRMKRIALGQVFPGLVIFGAAGGVAVSRVIDQKHWFTDALTGFAVGGAIGWFDYGWHFDEHGRPRARWADPTAVSFVPTPGGLVASGRW